MTKEESENILNQYYCVGTVTVEIYYNNEQSVEGHFSNQQIQGNNMVFTLEKTSTSDGEPPHHTIETDRICKIIINTFGKEPRVFE